MRTFLRPDGVSGRPWKPAEAKSCPRDPIWWGWSRVPIHRIFQYPPFASWYHSSSPEQQVGKASPGRGTEPEVGLRLHHTHSHPGPHTQMHAHTELHSHITHNRQPGHRIAERDPWSLIPHFSACVRETKIFDKTLESRPPRGPCLPTDPTKPALWPLRPFLTGSPKIDHLFLQLQKDLDLKQHDTDGQVS